MSKQKAPEYLKVHAWTSQRIPYKFRLSYIKSAGKVRIGCHKFDAGGLQASLKPFLDNRTATLRIDRADELSFYDLYPARFGLKFHGQSTWWLRWENVKVLHEFLDRKRHPWRYRRKKVTRGRK